MASLSKKRAKKFFGISGYLAYTLIVFCALLYIKFPNDTVRHWLEYKVESRQPKLKCRIKRLAPTLAGGLELSNIVLTPKNKGDRELFKIDSLRFRPQLISLLPGMDKKTFRVTGNGHGGTAQGKISIGSHGRSLDITMNLKKIAVESFTGVLDSLNRTGTGSLSGNISYQGKLDYLAAGKGTAHLTVNNGLIGLQESLFGMKEIDFTSVTGDMTLADGKVMIASGKFDSRLLLSHFDGQVTLRNDILLSSLEVKGTIEPRPELFTSQKGNKEVLLIRKQLKGGKLPFTVSGTLMEPGILFTLSGS